MVNRTSLQYGAKYHFFQVGLLCTFLKNGRVSIGFQLLAAHALSDQVKNLLAVLKLSDLNFLFSSLLSRIAPSMRTGPRAHVFGSRAHVHALIKFKI